MEIKAKKLTADGFSRYGKVIDLAPSTEPTISDEVLSYWKQQAVLNIGGAAEVGVLKVKKHKAAFSQMERHSETPEILISLGGGFIVPVAAPSEDVPEPGEIEVFAASASQAVMLETNCWHWVPSPTDADEITMLVLFKDNTSANDLVIEDLAEECSVAV